MPTAKPNSNGGLANPLSWRRYVAVTRLEDPWLLKAVFHYSRQLQTWSKTWSQAGRKPAANLLKTVFFSTFHLSSTRTNQRTCCGSRPSFRQEKSKAGQKRVANPHELVENLAANLVENQVCSWLE